MIVKNTENGWDIVFQPAHALLAARIAELLNESFQTEHWYETKLAIAIHDDHKVGFQSGGRSYVTENGAPKDFTLVDMSDKDRFVEVKNRLDNATRKHRWIGLLESVHVNNLYQDQEVSSELDELLKSEQIRRKDVLSDLKSTSKELQRAYDTMHWCDRCSLILCQDEIPAMGRRIEIITNSQGERFELWAEETRQLHIEPWPFLADEAEVSVEVHQLKELVYKDDDDLDQALRDCKPINRTWSFSR